MLEANKVKLGLFVVFSVIVFFAVIMALGVLDALQPRVKMMTLFKESVQGLESGSPVKFRGVPIGKVSDITINAREKLIRVDMEINMEKVRTETLSERGSKRRFTPQQFYDFIDAEIKAGLRCRMELAGITGLKYLEIDYLDPDAKDKPKGSDADFLAPQGLADDGVYYIPSTPSLLSGLRTSLSDTLSKVASIDYKGIADQISASLSSANKLFSDPQIKEIINHVNNVTGEVELSAKNINASFTPERMDKILAQISDTISALNALALKSKDALDAAQLGQTSAAFREAVKSFIESRKSFGETMMKFDEALDSLIEFVRYLDEDPGSLLKGKRKPALQLPKREPAPSASAGGEKNSSGN